jgi:adenylosuccinate synthase
MNYEQMGSAICFGVSKDCVNGASYGEICVGCGCCSKDKMVRYHARLQMYTEELETAQHFNTWIKGYKRLQRRNMKSNITYCKRRIAIYKRLIAEMESEL